MSLKSLLWVGASRADIQALCNVLHVFQKKSQKTAKLDIELARTRLAAVRRSRE